MARAILADITEEKQVPEIGNPKLCYCITCTGFRNSAVGKIARAWRKAATKKTTPIIYEPALINFPQKYATYGSEWQVINCFVPETAASLIIQYMVPNSYMQIINEKLGSGAVSTGFVNESVLTYWYYPAVVNGIGRLFFWCHMNRRDLRQLFEDLESNHMFATRFDETINEVVPDPDFQLADSFGNFKRTVYERNMITGDYENKCYSFEPDAIFCETEAEIMDPRDAVEQVNGGAWVTYWDTVEQIKEYVTRESAYTINEDDL